MGESDDAEIRPHDPGNESRGEVDSRPDLPEEGEALPESPYPLDETSRWMQADDVLAVRLAGAPVGPTSVAMDIAVPFLFKLHTLVAVLAAKITGREAGTRGPAPEVPEAGLLSFVQLAPAGSVVFRFGLGPGEAFRITPHGESSPTQDVINVLSSFLEASVDLDERDLIQLARELGPRVSNNYLDLIQTLRRSGVDTTWETGVGARPMTLTPVKMGQVEEILERPGRTYIGQQTLRGWMYRADGREHRFQFEREGERGERLPGTYPATLREKVRQAWDNLVEIQAVVTETHLLRQDEAVKVELELLDVVQVLGEYP